MQEFVASRYLREVLAPAVAGGPLPDLFARYVLDLDDRDSEAIGDRLAEIRDYWHLTEDRNPRYRNIIKRLQEEHSTARVTLTTEHARAALAEQLLAQREQEKEKSLAKIVEFEAQTQAVVDRAGGLSSRDGSLLELVGRSLGLDADFIARKLDSYPTAEESPAATLPDGIARTIRDDLRSYAELVERPRDGVSLFHFLGFDGVTAQQEIATVWAEQSAALRKVGISYQQELTSRLLSYVKTHLVDGDVLVYLATLTYEVAEQIRPDVARATFDDGEIDAAEAEQLINGAQQRGLDTTQARALVSRLAAEMNIQLVLGAVAEYISCPACNRPHAKEGAPPRCRHCGARLFVDCLTCKYSNPLSSTTCAHCGRNLVADQLARRSLRDARDLLANGSPQAAAQALTNAQTALEGDPDAAKVAAAVKQAIEAARGSWQEVRIAVRSRHLNAAACVLREMARSAGDLAGDSGRLPAEELAKVEAQLQDAQALIADSRARPDEAREVALVQALRSVADSDEALRELARIEPLAPAMVRVAVSDRSVSLEWRSSKSPGELRYKVLRVVGETPVLAGAREVGCTSGTTLSDPDAPQGEIASYAVICERAGASGPPAWAQPIVVAYEAKALELIDGEGQVELRWAPLGPRGFVEVLRCPAGGGTEATLVAGAAGVVDRDVVNGERYRYRVRVAYPGLGGATMRTGGLVVYGAPAARPTPLMDLGAQSAGDEVLLSYEPPPMGNVSVIRCEQEPDVRCGQELQAERLGSLGQVLQAASGGARDRAPRRLAWYLPVTIAGGCAIAGQAVRHAQIPAIEDVEIADYRSTVRITWSWPDDVRAAIVAWRGDRQPNGPEDPDASIVETTLAQYSQNGGIELPADGAQALFVAVYPSMRLDGETVLGTSAGRSSKASLSRRAKVDVCYQVRRRGLRGKRLHLSITAPADQPLPDLVVVARPGDILPRSTDDGRVIARLGGSSGVTERQLDLQAVGRPLALRLFPAMADLATTHRVLDPDSSELIVR